MPWDDASDIALPDLASNSQSNQDSIHNAVMSSRPIVNAVSHKDKQTNEEDTVDDLLDAQFFQENHGEKILEEIIESFVNDGHCTVLTEWVSERRPMTDVQEFPAVGASENPAEVFREHLKNTYKIIETFQTDEEGWDFRLKIDGEDEPVIVKFYTKGPGEPVEMVTTRKAIVFEGPRPKSYEHEDVLCPPRSRNLQAPSASNPGGATHVILVDTITIDEIRRMQRQGFYDLLSSKDVDEMEALGRKPDHASDGKDQQKSIVQGQEEETPSKEATHRPLTRMMVFDLYDADGDGINEDVVWWYIEEAGKVAKAVHMGEMWPMNPPERPIAEATFLPVHGYYEGMGLLEMLEGVHDWKKSVVDLTMDAGALTSMPFGFYRPTSNLKPEPMNISPGVLFPLNNPQQDIHFPQIKSDATQFGLSMMSVADSWEERLSLVGDIQQGRVPAGKSSALRTSGGISQLLQQGEARPERILRRFFTVLATTFRHMHQLNQIFLPQDKKIRLLGVRNAGQDPYRTIENRQSIKGKFQFDFRASINNASAQRRAQSLTQFLQLTANPIALQTGIAGPEQYFRHLWDIAKANGIDPVNYIKAPTADSNKPTISAEEAMNALLAEQLPGGVPVEPTEIHIQRLQAFIEDPRMETLRTPPIERLIAQYMQITQERLRAEQEQERLQQAAGQLGQAAGAQVGGGGGGGNAGPPVTGGTPGPNSTSSPEGAGQPALPPGIAP
jgi:hypothetical protein